MGKVPHGICEVTFDLIVFVLVLIFLPITLILLSPLYLWRLTIKLLAKCSNLDRMLSELDTFFLFNDPKILQSPEFVISVVVTLEGEVDPEVFKSNVYNDIVNVRHENGELIYGRLQQRLTSWMGFMFFQWIPDFDISNHVQMTSEVKVIEENKHEFIGSRIREPFPVDGALWDVRLAPSRNRTFVNLRIHHCISDGSSILKAIMTRAMKINPNEFIFPKKRLALQESSCQKFLKFYKHTIGLPGNFVRQNLELRKRNPFQSQSYGLQKNGKIIMSTTGKIPLYKFKRTKLRLGVNFTALVNSAISGALRKYLAEVGSIPTPTFEIQSFNGTAFVPMPRHPNDTILNWCGMNNMRIPLGGETLDKRLELANTQLKSTMGSNFGVAQYYYLKMIGNFPTSVLQGVMLKNSSGFFYSNMPGPTAPGHLWNNFMSDVMFWSPVIGTNGIAISILSYNEYVRIGLAADSYVIKGYEKLRQMTEFIESELEIIFNLETV